MKDHAQRILRILARIEEDAPQNKDVRVWTDEIRALLKEMRGGVTVRGEDLHFVLKQSAQTARVSKAKFE